VDIDAEKIAHGVVVFSAIETARGDVAGIGGGGFIQTVKLGAEPSGDGLELIGIGPGLFLGGHFALLDSSENQLPGFAAGLNWPGSEERGDVKIAGGFGAGVAFKTVLGEERLKGFEQNGIGLIGGADNSMGCQKQEEREEERPSRWGMDHALRIYHQDGQNVVDFWEEFGQSIYQANRWVI
jgi:hypothetical protein